MLVQHHVKYQEIHGVDEIVEMTQSEHRKLHCRLRKEGLCNIPAVDLNRIATAAHARTDKCVRRQNIYQKTDYAKKLHKEYLKQNLRRLVFTENMVPNVQFREDIDYNRKSGTVSYCAYFKATGGRQLIYQDV